MVINILFCSVLVLLNACTFKSSDLKKKPEIVRQYLITFKNGQSVDTSLQAELFYNSKAELEKVVNYFQNKVIKTTVYLKKDSTELKQYLSKSDNIIYVVKNKSKESDFCNGNLIVERYYDSVGNITSQVNYNASGLTIVKEDFVYSYQSNGKKDIESFLWNTDTVNTIRYLYKDSLLVEKYYLKNKCCDRNQPIPVDKVIYEYDKKKNLSKEIEIVDMAIKRDYKNEFNGYYNEVTIKAYVYDSLNRLIDKKVYTPNFSEDPNVKISQLYEPPTSLKEEYLYKYF